MTSLPRSCSCMHENQRAFLLINPQVDNSRQAARQTRSSMHKTNDEPAGRIRRHCLAEHHGFCIRMTNGVIKAVTPNHIEQAHGSHAAHFGTFQINTHLRSNLRKNTSQPALSVQHRDV